MLFAMGVVTRCRVLLDQFNSRYGARFFAASCVGRKHSEVKTAELANLVYGPGYDHAFWSKMESEISSVFGDVSGHFPLPPHFCVDDR